MYVRLGAVVDCKGRNRNLIYILLVLFLLIKEKLPGFPLFFMKTYFITLNFSLLFNIVSVVLKVKKIFFESDSSKSYPRCKICAKEDYLF